MPAIMGPADPTGVGSPLGVVPQTVAMPQKMPRTDRLEVCLPPNYIRPAGAQHGAAGAQCPMAGPNQAPVYQVPAAGAPQNRVSPVSTIQSVNQSLSSPTTTTTSVCAPIHNPHQAAPLHSLVYVHAYYEGPYVPIYVRT